MPGPGSTNTVIVAVVVFLVVALGAGVFFWWRSMYGVWSAKRRNPAARGDGLDPATIVVVSSAYSAPHDGRHKHHDDGGAMPRHHAPDAPAHHDSGHGGHSGHGTDSGTGSDPGSGAGDGGGGGGH